MGSGADELMEGQEFRGWLAVGYCDRIATLLRPERDNEGRANLATEPVRARTAHPERHFASGGHILAKGSAKACSSSSSRSWP
jgi:hypothetical protein